jgi:nitrogen fixation protein
VGESIAEVGSEGDAGGALGMNGWHVKFHGQPRSSDVTRTG